MTNAVDFYEAPSMRHLLRRTAIKSIDSVTRIGTETQGEHLGGEYVIKMTVSGTQLHFTVIIWDHMASYHLLELYLMDPTLIRTVKMKLRLRSDLVAAYDAAN